MRKTRIIKTDDFDGYVHKLSSQFQGKWCAYAMQVKNKKTDLSFRTVITKMHKMWINDHDPYYARSLNDMVSHILKRYA